MARLRVHPAPGRCTEVRNNLRKLSQMSVGPPSQDGGGRREVTSWKAWPEPTDEAGAPVVAVGGSCR